MQDDNDYSHLDFPDRNDLAQALVNGCYIGSRDPEIQTLIERAASGTGEYCDILAAMLIPTKASKPKPPRREPRRRTSLRRPLVHGDPMPWPPLPKK